MQLTWYGHSTWHVTVGETSFLIDPFFANPLTETDPEMLDVPDYLLITHGHADHIGDLEHFASETTVVGTPEITTWIGETYGADETIGMNLGGTVACGDASVTMIQAMHSNSIQTDPSMEVGVPAGFIISDGGPDSVGDPATTSFYHTGDTALMSELRDVVGEFFAPDGAAIPIGDHFTMGPRQAAVAVDWMNADHVFPMHYDTFPPIEQDPQDFVTAVKNRGCDANVHVLAADESFEL